MMFYDFFVNPVIALGTLVSVLVTAILALIAIEDHRCDTLYPSQLWAIGACLMIMLCLVALMIGAIITSLILFVCAVILWTIMWVQIYRERSARASAQRIHREADEIVEEAERRLLEQAAEIEGRL